MRKINVVFKTPDVFDQVMPEIGCDAHPIGELGDDEGADDCSECEDMRVYARQFLSQWISSSEYVQIEFDPDEDTATVVRRR